MGGLFAKRHSQSDIDAHDRAVYDLKIQRDRLTKHIDNSIYVMGRETAAVKELLALGHKDRAKLVLRKKKYTEKLIESTRAKLMTVEELVNSVEFAKMQGQVFAALVEGKNQLERINREVCIEDVEKLMEETEEAIAYQEEVSALLGNELGARDEQQILDELAMIEEQEALEIELPNVPETKHVELESTRTEQVDRDEPRKVELA